MGRRAGRLIDKAEIERVKRSHDLAVLAEQKGVRLKRNGKQLVGLYPFHAGQEPFGLKDFLPSGFAVPSLVNGFFPFGSGSATLGF